MARALARFFSGVVAEAIHGVNRGFQRAIIQCLSAAPRSGSPGTFSAEQIVGLIGSACEPPEHRGRPVTSWTGQELADEARQRGLVESISASQVNRFLAFVGVNL